LPGMSAFSAGSPFLFLFRSEHLSLIDGRCLYEDGPVERS
jgi:hypothetical protein